MSTRSRLGSLSSTVHELAGVLGFDPYVVREVVRMLVADGDFETSLDVERVAGTTVFTITVDWDVFDGLRPPVRSL